MLPKKRNAIASVYLASLTLLYLVVALHTPLVLFASAPHDDGLYISLGQFLAEGRWLGPFNQFTLMKGPGYPAFLALNHWLGTSITLAQALFHCVAVLLFVAIAHRFIRSYFLSGLLFALLLWHPTSLSMLRVLRDRIYFDQLLILLATLTWTLFDADDNNERALFAGVSGVVLGWFWLTREEGVWVLPALTLLFVAAFLRAHQQGRIRELTLSVLIALGVFAATQISVRTINWWVYGKFVGVDFREANFQRTLGALASVRSGETRPYIPVTRATRKLIYAVSPSLASLSMDLDGAIGVGWSEVSCASQPATCGEIGAGWFMWALRDAAKASGHFSSPAETSAFFGRVADEILAACAHGRLQCAPRFFQEMPAWTWAQLAERFPQRAARAIGVLLLVKPTPETPRGVSAKSSVGRSLRFLNYPSLISMVDADAISGWYYRSGAEWISMIVKRADGSIVDAQVERRSSPDIAAHFNDAFATLQRYTVRAKCNETCLLELQSEGGEKSDLSFAQLGKAPISYPLGGGTLYVDTAVFRGEGSAPTLLDVAANRLLTLVFAGYEFLLVPVAALGAIAFGVATVLHWRRAIWNVCFALAIACWTLVLSRIAILLLIDLTSFPALNQFTWHLLTTCSFALPCFHVPPGSSSRGEDL